jgi:two-component system, chemotaxis family, chemotaxis protein CheY
MPKHVLIVDDSKTMRDMVAFTLRGAGFSVVEAEDGQKALALLRSTTVDLTITDLNMPNMDGVTLIRNMRADPRHRSVPILMLTTEGDPANKAQGRAAGATGWIVKPFEPDKLVAVAHKVCP